MENGIMHGHNFPIQVIILRLKNKAECFAYRNQLFYLGQSQRGMKLSTSIGCPGVTSSLVFSLNQKNNKSSRARCFHALVFPLKKLPKKCLK